MLQSFSNPRILFPSSFHCLHSHEFLMIFALLTRARIAFFILERSVLVSVMQNYICMIETAIAAYQALNQHSKVKKILIYVSSFSTLISNIVYLSLFSKQRSRDFKIVLNLISWNGTHLVTYFFTDSALPVGKLFLFVKCVKCACIQIKMLSFLCLICPN